MKLSLALLAALLVPVPLLADNASRPTSFVGVPWGSAPAETLRILSARAGIAAPEEGAEGDKVELTGGTFAGQTAQKWTLEFNGGKFYAASVVLKPDGTASSLYRDLKQMLIAKYGPVSVERKPVTSASEKRDLRERRRNSPEIKSFGTAASWKFAPTLNDKERKVIELELAGPDGGETTEEDSLVLTVRYTNETLKPSVAAAAASAYKSEPSRKAVKVDDL